MGVRISRSLLQRVLADAAASPHKEVCGLLFGTAERIDAAERCANVAADPARFFEIDPAALIHAHRAARAGGPRPIGCYHSHPTGRARPSATDAAMAAGDGWLWLVVTAQAAALFRAVSEGTIEGRFDPISPIWEE